MRNSKSAGFTETHASQTTCSATEKNPLSHSAARNHTIVSLVAVWLSNDDRAVEFQEAAAQYTYIIIRLIARKRDHRAGIVSFSYYYDNDDHEAKRTYRTADASSQQVDVDGSQTTATTTSTTALSTPHTVTIHENERCWIGKGFGKGGLLPNDRGRYSLPDGSGRWKTAAQAFDAARPAGWKYIANASSDTDENDEATTAAAAGPWWFARDFALSAVENASTTKGAFHWVRFRGLQRQIVFDPSQFLHVDGDDNHCRRVLRHTRISEGHVPHQLVVFYNNFYHY